MRRKRYRLARIRESRSQEPGEQIGELVPCVETPLNPSVKTFRLIRSRRLSFPRHPERSVAALTPAAVREFHERRRP